MLHILLYVVVSFFIYEDVRHIHSAFQKNARKREKFA